MKSITLSITQKLSLLSLTLIIITSGILGFFLVERSTSVLVESALSEINHGLVDKGREFTQHIHNIREDVQVVAKLNSLQQLLQAESQSITNIEPFRQAVINDFTAIMLAKPSYLHVRYINAQGEEIVRIDRKRIGSEVYTIPDSELQNKLHRSYVQMTFAQPPGGIYVSDIELYKEHGVIVEPHQIGSRISMPLYDDDSKQLLGMVIINFEVGDFLEQMQASYSKRGQQLFITNKEGDYLLHPDPAKRFGFMLGERFQLQQELPQAEAFFAQQNKQSGFRLMQEIAQQNYVYVLALLNIDPASPDRYLVIAARQPFEDVVAEQRAVHRESLGWGILVVLIGAGVALIFARRLSAPLTQMTTVVDNYTHDNQTTIHLPSHRSDELGVLARSFRSMIERVDAAQQQLKKLNMELEQRVNERTQELQDSEALQKAILGSMSDAVLTTLPSGEIKEVNKAAESMFGIVDTSMIGSPLTCFISEGGAEENTRVGYRVDGTTFPAEVIVNKGEYGEQTIYTSVIRDMTERLAADKLKTEFVSTVSHELRTPLTAIKGTLELMAGNVLGEIPDKAKPMLDIACNNTNRLLIIINDLLDIQKIAEGKMEYNYTAMALGPFMQKAITSNQAYASQYQVEFDIRENVTDDVLIYADENRIMQVLSNLLSNAAKFSPEGGLVTLTVSTIGNMAQITIRDDGQGIPEAFRSRMFTKFSQADASDTRSKGGSGLGLVITKSIIEDHHGQIDYSSQPGQGTTFSVTLPLYRSKA